MAGPKPRSLRYILSLSVGICLELCFLGCSGPAHKYDAVVTGTVTIDGELAKSGTVTLHPTAKQGQIAIGRIYPDGSFSLRTGQGDLRESDGGTVPSGDYIVTVVVNGPSEPDPSGPGAPPIVGPLMVAEKYISRDTSDLRCHVKPGANVAVFDVHGASTEQKDVSKELNSGQGNKPSGDTPEETSK
jgi:hypothetical protein